ncbi:MAG: hypothetical protein B7C24_13235 [Bacteroidetes bacterium 4572_77]|nr:MAG: hypothetical protein B7C24_13235 [Bacteroidetes bacterium 4572_77]
MNRKVQISKYASLGLFIIVCGFANIFFNNVFFIHTHVLQDGRIIAHAHPYSKSEDGKRHDHARDELFQIDSITHSIYIFTAVEQIDLIEIFLYTFETSIPIYENFQRFSHFSIRGPPNIYC